MRRVLVLGPHPDDDAIGCGGTLFRHVLQGDVVHVILLTSGEQGGHGRPPEETAQLREEEARAAAAILGLETPEFWREPDGRLQVTDRLVGRLRNWLVQQQPALVYVTHDAEMHSDHRTAAELVRRTL